MYDRVSKWSQQDGCHYDRVLRLSQQDGPILLNEHGDLQFLLHKNIVHIILLLIYFVKYRIQARIEYNKQFNKQSPSYIEHMVDLNK